MLPRAARPIAWSLGVHAVAGLALVLAPHGRPRPRAPTAEVEVVVTGRAPSSARPVEAPAAVERHGAPLAAAPARARATPRPVLARRPPGAPPEEPPEVAPASAAPAAEAGLRASPPIEAPPVPAEEPEARGPDGTGGSGSPASAAPASPGAAADAPAGAAAHAGGAATGAGGAGAGGRPARPDPEAVRAAVQAASRYPRLARARGVEGTVVVRFRIGATGAVERIEILGSADPGLAEAALAAVRRGAPYRSPPGWVRVPVAFTLE